MKKVTLILFYLCLTFSAYAQWGYGGYGGYSVSPNVMSDPCVQAAMITAYSTANVNAQSMQMLQWQQQAAAAGYYAPTPVYNAPSTPSYNSSSSNSSYRRSSKTCGNCGDSGEITTTRGVASFGHEKWCSKCEKRVPSNHYHTTCPSCKGKDYW